MDLRRKRSLPIDRSVRDLDRQLAAVQKQIRQITHEVDRATPVKTAEATGNPSSRSARLDKFMKDMLSTAHTASASTRPARTELFDAGRETMKELESPEPAALAQKTEPDLFGVKMATAAMSPPATVPDVEKLAHYLSAGGIRSYRPLKHIQRKQRNRFFMWIGLSCAAFWLLYVVVR